MELENDIEGKKAPQSVQNLPNEPVHQTVAKFARDFHL